MNSPDRKKTFDAIDDLFDSDIDDLADIAGSDVPPPGSYILDVACAIKKVNDKGCVEAGITVVETVELKDDGAQPVANGTKFFLLFQIGNEFGVGNLKKFLKPFSNFYGVSKLGTLLKERMVEPIRLAAIVTNRADKNDPEKVYGGLKNVVIG